MKKIFALAFLILSATIFTSFRIAPPAAGNSLPMCTALSKVMKEEPNEYADLKGKLISTYNKDENYELVFGFDGWATSEWSLADGAISVDVTSELMSKEAATKLFENAASQISTCLGMEGNTMTAKGVEKLTIFTKDKNDIGLMLVSKKDKHFVLLTISRES